MISTQGKLCRLKPAYKNSTMKFSGTNESVTVYGATQAMILAGQKDAKKRVFLFFIIYFITGVVSE